VGSSLNAPAIKRFAVKSSLACFPHTGKYQVEITGKSHPGEKPVMVNTRLARKLSKGLYQYW